MSLIRSSRCIFTHIQKIAKDSKTKPDPAHIFDFLHTFSLNQPRSSASYNIVRYKHSKKKKEKQERTSNTIEITQTSGSSLPPIAKPSDQVKEEEIRDLQAEIAFHHKHAQYQEALEVSQTLLDRSIDHFGDQHPVTASSMNNIGLMQKYLGNFDKSREMYHKALSIYGDTVGTDHASYAATLNNLGNLLRSQSLLDEEEDSGRSISALQRLQLNEMAIEYFEQALTIRKEELGPSHPQTVTSHSNLGAAMASMLLQEQANRIHASNAKDLNSSTNNNDQTTPTSPLQTSKFTQTRWEAAEKHLRTALNTAIKYPRGKILDQKSSSSSSSSIHIQTLSAAGAAQNLAVFLKSKADILKESSTQNSMDTEDMYGEARNWYQEALVVRSNLLSNSHPDTISTKFSLAELYVAAYNDEESANQLRQEILDAYSVEERDAIKK